MKQQFRAVTWREGEWVVAQCLEIDVASQGISDDQAIENLREALALHFASPQASQVPQVREIDVEIGAA